MSNKNLAVACTVALCAVLAAAFSTGSLRNIGATTYRAAFAEAGGLVAGDSVIVSGMPAGSVTAVDLQDTWVEVTFTVDNKSVKLGDQTSAQIKAQTPLGKKALQLVSRGTQPLSDNVLIPLARTTSPYDVSAALQDLTRNITGIDQPRVGESMNVLAETLDAATPEMKPVLDGLTRISNTIGSRDQALSKLLSSTEAVSGVLANRDKQVQQLVGDGAMLLTAVNDQRAALDNIFANAAAMSQQLQGLVADNQQQLKPALDQLDQVLAILQRNRDSVSGISVGGESVLRSLGEVVSSFPGFNVYIANLPPWNIFPSIDRALKGSNLVTNIQDLLKGGS